MILIVGLYLDAAPERLGEFIECLSRNAANQWISNIQVMLETPCDIPNLIASLPALASPKIAVHLHGRRVTYKDLFAFANRNFAGQRVILANSDIFFDETLARLEQFDLTGKLLCLSRWDMQPDGRPSFFESPVSQDAWVFKAPIRRFSCSFHLGLPGSDNKLAWEAEHSGLEISNPSRSIRANHLHLSFVRRYTLEERLPGPYRSISSTFLGAPWLWFVVPCMGRLEDLRETIGSAMSQPSSYYLLVEYGCSDQSGKWVKAHYPEAHVLTCYPRLHVTGAEARNRGAALVHEDGILCFLDADVIAMPEFSNEILLALEPGSFLIPDRDDTGLSGTLVCTKADFLRSGGFDETFDGWGEEVLDLRDSLRREGLTSRTFSSSLLLHRPSQRECRGTTGSIHPAYRKAKSAIAAETAAFAISCAGWREIYDAVARHHTGEQADAEVSLASVTFSEAMGYTLDRLESGVSSHCNVTRPFGHLPETLRGRWFTQVVFGSASKVEVAFVTQGKLYVLAGTDWDGYYTASAWLRQVGRLESLPLVRTIIGTAFEVWSVYGQQGDRLVIPTQVILVADELAREPFPHFNVMSVDADD